MYIVYPAILIIKTYDACFNKDIYLLINVEPLQAEIFFEVIMSSPHMIFPFAFFFYISMQLFWLFLDQSNDIWP